MSTAVHDALPQELRDLYDEAAAPYIEGGGAISREHTRMKSWRYFLEVNSACNLHCPTCTKGNKEGYDHMNGIMDWSLMERCIEKIQRENRKAIVFLYGNSEPFLHPKLPECIVAVRSRKLNCQISTNLNYVRRLDEFVDAHPDLVIVSLSGFTQDTYVKGHAGGDVEKVKANMLALSVANRKHPRPIKVLVNYHVYRDNKHEVATMKAYAESLGFELFESYARAISMENAIQYCRSKDPDATPYAVQDGKPDWNHLLPAAGEGYKSTMDRIRIKPTDAVGMYGKYPAMPVCPVGDMFTFIRHDGKTSLCACVADRRITIGDYLDTEQSKLSEQRRGHAICQQCQKYRMNLYFHIVDREKWT